MLYEINCSIDELLWTHIIPVKIISSKIVSKITTDIKIMIIKNKLQIDKEKYKRFTVNIYRLVHSSVYIVVTGKKSEYFETYI